MHRLAMTRNWEEFVAPTGNSTFEYPQDAVVLHVNSMDLRSSWEADSWQSFSWPRNKISFRKTQVHYRVIWRSSYVLYWTSWNSSSSSRAVSLITIIKSERILPSMSNSHNCLFLQGFTASINKNTSLMQLISIYFTYSKSLHVSGRTLPIIRRIWYCTSQRLVLVR